MNDFNIRTDRREAMTITAGATLIPLAISQGAQAALPVAKPIGTGRDQAFDADWRFSLGVGNGQEITAFDDSHWRKVDLPHDWSIEDLAGGTTGPFHKTSKGGTATGYTEGGEGWYRKHFRVDAFPADARIEILFDGIYGISDVWINGQSLGENFHGYRPFAYDVTPHLLRDGDNVIAVRVRNLGQNSRWYSGSGIYRQVTLDVIPAGAYIARWGVGAWTRKIEGGTAEIDITTVIKNPDTALSIITKLRDARGAVVGEAHSALAENVKQTIKVKIPHLWSPSTPYLYALETEIRRGDAVVDHMTQPFGIRIITMDPVRGMQINGTHTNLRGGCIHHDNGLLGACAYPQADERRVRLLKARGYNAIRSSHNPMSRSLRNACDKLGMLVIDEAFDMWHIAKLPDDFSNHFKEHWHEVIESMVLSARNNPCVIMWSIGNEIPYRATDEGVELEWKLANAIRTIDPSRPVTAGLNGVLGAPMTASNATARPGRAGKVDNASTIFLDVPGYNYRLEDIEAEHITHPERVVYASETFPHDAFDYVDLMKRAPYFMGEFVWTAMDYIGEAGVGATANIKKGSPPYYFASWPWVNAYCGDIDLIGNQKTPSLARDVAWGISALEMAVHRPVPDDKQEFVAMWGWPDELPSWNWAGSEGKPMAVKIYTSADKIELLLNGKSVGSKNLSAKDKMQATFQIAYSPGTLEAVAYKGGKIIGRRKLETVGTATKLRLTPEQPSNKATRQSLSYVRVDVMDGQGRVLPEETHKISLTINGPAELVGFGSSNPLAVGSFQSHDAQSYRGHALAILRSTGAAGTVRIEAKSDGLSSASTIIKLS